MRHLIEPEGNRAVVRWLRDNSERPIAAMNAWSLLLAKLHRGTGQVLLSRSEIAGEVGVTPRDITYIMKELADIGAISRRPDGSRVRYFLNPELFVTPQGQAQEEAGRIPVFEIVESEEKEAGKGVATGTREQLSIELPGEERGASSWTPEEATRLKTPEESDAGMLRGTAPGIWRRWRDRLFLARQRDD